MHRYKNLCLSLSSNFTADTATIAAEPTHIEGQVLLSPMGLAAAERTEVRLNARKETIVGGVGRREEVSTIGGGKVRGE